MTPYGQKTNTRPAEDPRARPWKPGGDRSGSAGLPAAALPSSGGCSGVPGPRQNQEPSKENNPGAGNAVKKTPFPGVPIPSCSPPTGSGGGGLARGAPESVLPVDGVMGQVHGPRGACIVRGCRLGKERDRETLRRNAPASPGLQPPRVTHTCAHTRVQTWSARVHVQVTCAVNSSLRG